MIIRNCLLANDRNAAVIYHNYGPRCAGIRQNAETISLSLFPGQATVLPSASITSVAMSEDGARHYAGDVTPEEAWDILKTDKSAVLIDCRTDAEWSYVD